MPTGSHPPLILKPALGWTNERSDRRRLLDFPAGCRPVVPARQLHLARITQVRSLIRDDVRLEMMTLCAEDGWPSTAAAEAVGLGWLGACSEAIAAGASLAGAELLEIGAGGVEA